MVAQQLEREWQTYQSERPRLIRESIGKYVVIHGDKVLGTRGTLEDALELGYSSVSLSEAFFVHQILDPEPVHVIRGAVPA